MFFIAYKLEFQFLLSRAESLANFANFGQIRESLRCEKFYYSRKFMLPKCKISQIFRLAKVSAPKVYVKKSLSIELVSVTI